MQKFDVIVVGGGVGLTFIDTVLSKEMTIALIEKSKLGGTCLTKGCIPSKILVSPADMVRKAQHAANYGVECEIKKLDWEMISQRMWSQINKSERMEKSLSKTEELTLFKGTAEFVEEKTLKVIYSDGEESEKITADTIILCPGARTFIPPINGLEETGYITSETFFGPSFPEKLPESIAIVGAGAVGAEFTHIMAAQGVKVHLIERINRILPAEEETISEFVAGEMRRYGVDVYVETDITKCEKGKNGLKKLYLKNSATGEENVIETSLIMIATGVKSNSDLLKISNTSIKIDEKGWIITDEYLRTSVDGIWALGDINGKYQFRHKANYEAEIVVNNIFNEDNPMEKVRYNSVPWAVYTHPQVAHVGMTEKQARVGRNGLFVGVKYYSSVAKGFAIGYKRGDPDVGFVKLIADADLKILGAHIVGEEAAILIQSYVYLMNANCTCISEKKLVFNEDEDESIRPEPSGTLRPISRSMAIHPSLSELTAWIIGEMKWVEF